MGVGNGIHRQHISEAKAQDMSTPVSIREDLKLAQVLHDLALECYTGLGKAEFESKERYRWLREFPKMDIDRDHLCHYRSASERAAAHLSG